MRFIIRLILLTLLIFFCAHPVMADMVFPARLELVEIQPAVFDVQFNLPVQNQTRIKANPVLPDICIVTEPPVVKPLVSMVCLVLRSMCCCP